MKIKTSKANTSLQKVNPLYVSTNMRDYHVRGPLGSGFYIEDFQAGYSQIIEDYLARVSTEAFTTPSNAVLDALETFFSAINTSSLDFVHVFRMGDVAYENASSVKFIRSSLDLGVYTNGLTYGATGITGDGATTNFDTQFNPGADATKYALDSACRFMYVGVDATLGTAMDGNASGSTNRMVRTNSNQQRINQGGGNLNLAVDLSGTGYRAINRSDATNIELYTGLTRTNRTATSTAVINADQVILQSSTVFSNSTVEMYGMGASLSEADHNAIRNAWITYRALI